MIKLSLYSGCHDQTKSLIEYVRLMNESPYVESYLDYFESLKIIFNSVGEDDDEDDRYLFKML